MKLCDDCVIEYVAEPEMKEVLIRSPYTFSSLYGVVQATPNSQGSWRRGMEAIVRIYDDRNRLVAYALLKRLSDGDAAIEFLKALICARSEE